MEEKNNILLCQNCGTLNAEDANWCKVCGDEMGPSPIRILPNGTSLDHGRYTVSGYLGYGGSVITYKAKQKNFTAEVAIREYYPFSLVNRDGCSFEIRTIAPAAELAFDQGKTQFLNEGNNLRTLGRVSNIVQVHDVFEDNGTVYMAEDFIGGESLSDILERKGKLSFEEAMVYIVPVMKALMQVHRQGIIHRDIKPSNIMISGDEPYLIDFGISKRIARNTTSSTSYRNIQKGSHTEFTRGYAAPEQITGQAREGTWTDVYGIAATLYRMVTGGDPDDAEARLVRDLLPHPFDIGAALTREQSDAIMAGLALDTITRFQTMQAFLTALTVRDHKQDGSEKHKDVYVPEPENNRNVLIRIVAGALFILLIVLGLWKREDILDFWQSWDDADQEEPNEEEKDNIKDETDTSSEQAISRKEEIREEEQAQTAEETKIVSMNIKMLDSQREPLRGYHVRVSQILTGPGQNVDSRLLFNGQTDSFGWLPVIETEEADGFMCFELQETGNSKEISMKDLAAAGGQMELLFPFHLYSETYTYGGHTYAAGNIYDISGLYSYDKVEEYCESLGGHLAVINNAGEDAFLYSNFCTPGISTAFFGYTDQDSEGHWEWAFGHSDYTNWTRAGGVHPGPDNGNGAAGWGPENYAEYNCGDDAANDGSWNDAKFAVNTSYFIIEWEFDRPAQD